MSRRPAHDASFRQLFSHALLLEHLLRGFIHEDWVAQLDFTRLEPVETQRVAERLEERRHDLVWRVPVQAPEADEPHWLYLYVLVEFQSRDDPWMALRMHTYVGLLYQSLIRARLVPAGTRLPPVFPLVIHHGRRRWQAARQLSELVHAPGRLAAYCPQQSYHVLDLGVVAPVGLPDNVAAALIALEQTEQLPELREHVRWLLRILHHPHHDSLRRAFTVYLRRSLLKRLMPEDNLPELNDLEEVDAMLAARATLWTRQWKREGLEEGREIGRQEGRQTGQADLLARLLEHRFGPLPPAIHERLLHASDAALATWALAVLDAPTLAAVFEAD